MTEQEDEEDDKVCKACGAGFDTSEELQKALEQKEEGKESGDEETDESSSKYSERTNLKVYDMPVELKNKYISLAKLDYDNQLWKVLEAGFEALNQERKRKVPQLEQEIENLQKQIGMLKVQIAQMQEKEDKDDSGVPSTFGDQRTEEDDELLDHFSKQ